MDFSWTKEQEMLRKTVREFAAKKLTPNLSDWDKDHYFPYKEALKPMGELGFFGAVIPEEYGGEGMGFVASMIVTEETAREYGLEKASDLEENADQFILGCSQEFNERPDGYPGFVEHYGFELGDVSPTRDFNFVKDVVRGFLAVAASGKTIGEEINIASNSEISMADTLALIKSIMKSDVQFITDEQRIRPEKSEVFRLWGDNKKITNLTDWEPACSLEAGLEETVSWYTNPHNLQKFKSAIYNI